MRYAKHILHKPGVPRARSRSSRYRQAEESQRSGAARKCRMKLARIGLIALMLLVFAAPAHAAWEYTRWGMNEAQAVTASRRAVRSLPAAERRMMDTRVEYRARGVFSVEGLRMNIAFGFDTKTGGLACVSGRGAAAQGDALRQRLIARFGPPEFDDQDERSGEQDIGWTTPDKIDLVITSAGFTLLHCAPGY